MKKIEELKKRVGEIYDIQLSKVSDFIEDVESLLDDVEKEVDDLEEKVKDLEHLEEDAEHNEEINTPQRISFRADNLLDTQIMEAFKEIMEHPKTNHVQLLQQLQEVAKTGNFLPSFGPTVTIGQLIKKKVA